MSFRKRLLAVFGLVMVVTGVSTVVVIAGLAMTRGDIQQAVALIQGMSGSEAERLAQLLGEVLAANTRMLAFLLLGTAVGVVFVVGGVVYLYWYITTSFRALSHDIELIRLDNTTSGMHLSASRRDEFGRIAQMLAEIVVNRGQLQSLAAEQQRLH
ncbi:MAG: hypothetical protein ACM31L_14790, partial [Actinomycetota bacterium]